VPLATVFRNGLIELRKICRNRAEAARPSGMIAALTAQCGGSLESPIAMSHSERFDQKAARRNRPSAPEAHRRSDRASRLLPRGNHRSPAGEGYRVPQPDRSPLDTTTPQGRLVFHMFGALAEFERSLIRERTQAGLAAARRAGRTGGRPPKLTDDDIEAAKALLANPDIGVTGRSRRVSAWRRAAAVRRFRPFGDSRGICRVRTPKPSFKFSIGMAHRDPFRKFALSAGTSIDYYPDGGSPPRSFHDQARSGQPGATAA
jgi:hypothetical protein